MLCGLVNAHAPSNPKWVAFTVAFIAFIVYQDGVLNEFTTFSHLHTSKLRDR